MMMRSLRAIRSHYKLRKFDRQLNDKREKNISKLNLAGFLPLSEEKKILLDGILNILDICCKSEGNVWVYIFIVLNGMEKCYSPEVIFGVFQIFEKNFGLDLSGVTVFGGWYSRIEDDLSLDD